MYEWCLDLWQLLLKVWIWDSCSYRFSLNLMKSWCVIDVWICDSCYYSFHFLGNSFSVSGKHFPGILSWTPGIIIWEKGTKLTPYSRFSENEMRNLGFLAWSVESCRILLSLELQDDVYFIFSKTPNKESIWFPFPRIGFLGAGIRCHGSVSRKPWSSFPENADCTCFTPTLPLIK